MNTFVTSDTHFLHNKPFVYEKRGFNSVDEMDEEIIRRWNETVSEDDIVYHLGDVFFGKDLEAAGNILTRLNGIIRVIRGNHDTDNKVDYMLNSIPNIESVNYSDWVRVGKDTVILCHYPVFTGQPGLGRSVYNFFGHTHQITNFLEGFPLSYHVGMDSHDLRPVLIEDALKELKEKITQYDRTEIY